MKCFTLKSQIYILHGGPPVGLGATAVTSRYPTAVDGIALNGDREVSLCGYSKLKVSDELLRLPAGSAITREDRDITVLRASVDKKPNGDCVLVPERDDDRDGALIVVDVGGASHLYYEVNDAAVVARHVEDSGRWGRDEQLIVQVQPFERVHAIRRNLKWVFWGEMRTRETLHISFDGTKVFYDVTPKRGEDW